MFGMFSKLIGNNYQGLVFFGRFTAKKTVKNVQLLCLKSNEATVAKNKWKHNFATNHLMYVLSWCCKNMVLRGYFLNMTKAFILKQSLKQILQKKTLNLIDFLFAIEHSILKVLQENKSLEKHFDKFF